MSRTEELLTALVKGGDVSNFKCRSRIETYLKKCCCGESCDDLTPRNNVEYLLGELSKKSSGETVEVYDGTVE